MNMIVAADKKNGIGYQGKLLVTIPFDQQLFRKETIGKVVVMGRKTLESLPGGHRCFFVCGYCDFVHVLIPFVILLNFSYYIIIQIEMFAIFRL